MILREQRCQTGLGDRSITRQKQAADPTINKQIKNTKMDCQVIEKVSSAPAAPPFTGLPTTSYDQKEKVLNKDGSPVRGYSLVTTCTRNMWDRLFHEGYRADVRISTDDGGDICAHADVLGMASPVLRNILRHTKGRGRQRSISIHGVPHKAVQVFIRFLYSSCYEEEEMNEFVLHLLVLSHAYVVPQLKRACELQLERSLLATENVVDVFQLALLCDAPRLSIACHRMILKNFKAVIYTEGWKAMKQSHPNLEREIIESVIEAASRKQERMKKVEEEKIYLQLYEAMEALVHICRDGCRTIGPHDKVLKGDQPPCTFSACKGLELLVRHFAACKLRVPGGCIHCKRMWQLLELHSRLCANSDECRVPLCRNFKERLQTHSKKDEIKWKILVRKILTTKRFGGGQFFSLEYAVST